MRRRGRVRCRRWWLIPSGWVHAAGRQRLRCARYAGHPDRDGCASVDGWLWKVPARPAAGAVAGTPALLPVGRERYPQRWWRCQGRYPDGSPCRTRLRATEDTARVKGWRVHWRAETAEPDQLCPGCAVPAAGAAPPGQAATGGAPLWLAGDEPTDA